LDEAVLRKIRRAEETAKRDIADTSDVEIDVDHSVVAGSSREVKLEKRGGRGRPRRMVEPVDDD
jgi:hypothetical protein